MMTSGDSANLAANLVEDENSAIFFVSYLEEESPGRDLLRASRGSKIKVLVDESVSVQCDIGNFSFSAHANADQIIDFAKAFDPAQIMLVHGDKSSLLNLAKKTGSLVPEPLEILHADNRTTIHNRRLWKELQPYRTFKYKYIGKGDWREILTVLTGRFELPLEIDGVSSADKVVFKVKGTRGEIGNLRRTLDRSGFVTLRVLDKDVSMKVRAEVRALCTLLNIPLPKITPYVVMQKLENGIAGQFNPVTRRMQIDPNSFNEGTEETKLVLDHEIAHWIQSISLGDHLEPSTTKESAFREGWAQWVCEKVGHDLKSLQVREMSALTGSKDAAYMKGRLWYDLIAKEFGEQTLKDLALTKGLNPWWDAVWTVRQKQTKPTGRLSLHLTDNAWNGMRRCNLTMTELKKVLSSGFTVSQELDTLLITQNFTLRCGYEQDRDIYTALGISKIKTSDINLATEIESPPPELAEQMLDGSPFRIPEDVDIQPAPKIMRMRGELEAARRHLQKNEAVMQSHRTQLSELENLPLYRRVFRRGLDEEKAQLRNKLANDELKAKESLENCRSIENNLHAQGDVLEDPSLTFPETERAVSKEPLASPIEEEHALSEHAESEYEPHSALAETNDRSSGHDSDHEPQHEETVDYERGPEETVAQLVKKGDVKSLIGLANLCDANWEASSLALNALDQMDYELIVEPLTEALDDKDPLTRETALNLAGRIAPKIAPQLAAFPRFLQGLVRCSTDSDEYVRVAGNEALAEICVVLAERNDSQVLRVVKSIDFTIPQVRCCYGELLWKLADADFYFGLG
jgi:hypothetical protein